MHCTHTHTLSPYPEQDVFAPKCVTLLTLSVSICFLLLQNALSQLQQNAEAVEEYVEKIQFLIEVRVMLVCMHCMVDCQCDV